MCTFIPKQTKEKMRKIVNVSDHHTEIDRTIQAKNKTSPLKYTQEEWNVKKHTLDGSNHTQTHRIEVVKVR